MRWRRATWSATFINNLYAPVLYITSAIYSGW